MDDKLLKGRILLVKSPTSLPSATEHKDAILNLSRTAEAVILFSHGDDEYDLPPEFTLPANVYHVRYSYETLDRDTTLLKRILEELGLSVRTRHLDATLPFILTGSVIALPAGKTLDVYEPSNDNNNGKVEIKPTRTTWGLSD